MPSAGNCRASDSSTNEACGSGNENVQCDASFLLPSQRSISTESLASCVILVPGKTRQSIQHTVRTESHCCSLIQMKLRSRSQDNSWRFHCEPCRNEACYVAG